MDDLIYFCFPYLIKSTSSEFLHFLTDFKLKQDEYLRKELLFCGLRTPFTPVPHGPLGNLFIITRYHESRETKYSGEIAKTAKKSTLTQFKGELNRFF